MESSDSKYRRVVPNADNTYLGPMGPMGWVDDVNGLGAEEIPGFIPTRHELIQLVKYWASRELDIMWDFFCFGQSGSTDISRGPFSRRRVGRIARLLGEDEVRKAIDEVYDKFQKDYTDPKLWDIFMNGDLQQWEAVQDEFWRRVEEKDRKQE